jgi:hypothetical protein
MKRELNQKQVLAFPCPTCGVPPGARCELSAGLPRINPHQDRRFIAADESSALMTLHDGSNRQVA